MVAGPDRLGGDESFVVKIRVDRQVVGEPFHLFRRAPGSPEESIYVGPEFGASVVKAEERVEADFLQFPPGRSRSRVCP